MEPLDAPALCLDALLREQARVGDKSSGKGRTAPWATLLSTSWPRSCRLRLRRPPRRQH
jgi:hypothetical protein